MCDRKAGDGDPDLTVNCEKLLGECPIFQPIGGSSNQPKMVTAAGSTPLVRDDDAKRHHGQNQKRRDPMQHARGQGVSWNYHRVSFYVLPQIPGILLSA
jgi:hypothetical protein